MKLQNPKQQLDTFKRQNMFRNWGLDIPEIPSDSELKSHQMYLLCPYLGKSKSESDVSKTIRELWDCVMVYGNIKKKIGSNVDLNNIPTNISKHAKHQTGAKWVVYDADANMIQLENGESRHLNHVEVLMLAIFAQDLFKNERSNFIFQMREFLSDSYGMMILEKRGKTVSLSIL